MDFITLDTETQKGKAFLACVDNGKKFTDVLINNKADVIQFLDSIHSMSKTAFCYNLEYDVCALLKYFGYNAILDLYLQRSLCFGNMFIRSVPNKFLILTKYYLHKKEVSREEIVNLLKSQEKEIKRRLRSKGKLFERERAGKGKDLSEAHEDKLIYFITIYNKLVSKRDRLKKKEFFAFDMWQFYEMSLDKASSKYLKEGKGDIPKSWMSKLRDKFQNPTHRKRIIKYCRKDARLTYKLSEKFIGMLSDCGIHPKRFYSSAYIAKNFIKSRIQVPIVDDPDIIKFMQPVFRGGRTEVMQRGTFKNTVLSDMNSAYGRALADLKRIYHSELSHRIDKKADYYFADCEIELPKNYINPVPVKFNMWKYPYGRMRATIDNRTMDNVHQAGGKILKVHRVLNIYCNEDYPFRSTINKMFAQRKKSESHNYVFKRIIVSYIGKLHEQNYSIRTLSVSEKPKVLGNLHQFGRKNEDFEEIIQHACPTCYSIGQVRQSCRNSVCVEYRKEYKGVTEPPVIHYQGDNIFATEKKLKHGTNIIYAALVTSTIRNIMYEEGIKLGSDLISFLTDGIFSKRPLKHYGSALGDFSKKYEGELYLLGSGMYQTADTINEDGKKQFNVKFRGFNSDKVNLRKLSRQYKRGKTMRIPILERTGIGRAVGSVKKFNDFNMLNPSKKKLGVNFDTNRVWDTPFKNYGEALKTHIQSEPVGL